eukprot:692818-Pyramimonas_sp.AAC.1
MRLILQGLAICQLGSFILVSVDGGVGIESFNYANELRSEDYQQSSSSSCVFDDGLISFQPRCAKAD